MSNIKKTLILSSLVISIALTGCTNTSRNINSNNKPLSQEQLGKIATKYFIAHPDQMMKVLVNMQTSLRNKQVNNAKTILINNYDWLVNSNIFPILGNKDASTTLLFVYDFQCIYCHQEYPYIQKLIKNNKNIKVVFIPLHIFGDNSLYANQVSFQAHKQKKFFEFYNLLFKENLIEGKLKPKNINDAVKKLNIKFTKTRLRTQ